MKKLRTTAVCLAVLCSLGSAAQSGNSVPVNEPDYNRSQLFQDKPASIPVAKEMLNSLFNEPVGRSVSVALSEESAFRFDGEVVSAVSKYNNSIRSVVIRSVNFPGARMVVSLLTAADGTVSYTGRIISLQHGDLYELKTTAGSLFLVKKKFYDLVNE